LNGLGEVSGDVGERRDEEVAEAVAFEVALVEAELEEFGEEVFILGERDHAVANISWRKHLEVFSEAAGGASVVGDGDDGGEVTDETGKRWGCGLPAAVGMGTGLECWVGRRLGVGLGFRTASGGRIG
jgi:hypothetical protein